jgi:hypothetical protein
MVSIVYSILRDKGDVMVTKVEMPEEAVAKVGKGSCQTKDKQDRATTKVLNFPNCSTWAEIYHH